MDGGTALKLCANVVWAYVFASGRHLYFPFSASVFECGLLIDGVPFYCILHALQHRFYRSRDHVSQDLRIAAIDPPFPVDQNRVCTPSRHVSFIELRAFQIKLEFAYKVSMSADIATSRSSSDVI